jgi:hypothetical protein
MEFFILYLLMILENVQGWLIAVSILSGVIIGWSMLNALLEGDPIPPFCKWLIPVCIVLSLSATLIPSKKEMAIIAAAGVTYNVVTSDAAKEIGGKGVDLLNKKLDEMLKDEPTQVVK